MATRIEDLPFKEMVRYVIKNYRRMHRDTKIRVWRKIWAL